MVAGFYAPGADARAIAEVAPAQTTVLVIDEAHTMPGAVAEVLLAHAQRAAGGPVRVVLLARNAGDWWTNAIPDRVAQSPVASAACETAATMALGPVATDPADRREAFLEAARAFRERLSPGTTEPDPEVPDLSGAGFDAILFVQLAAARALEGDGAAQQRPEDLVAWALKREGRYWRATAAAAEPPLQVDGAVLERAVAVATLAIADSEDEAAAALSAIPDLAGDARGQRAVARWLRHLYPHAEGDSWLPGLVPDVLGDALLAAVLAESPSIARGLLDEPSPEQAQSVLRALDRAARAHDGLEALLSELVGAAAASAVAGGARRRACSRAVALASLVSRALALEPDPELAGEMLAEIPGSTVALRELAAVAAGLVVEGRRAAAQQDPAARPALAQALDRHAIRLSDLGRLEEALRRGGAGGGAAARAGERGPRRQAPPGAAALPSLSNRRAALGGHQAGAGAGEEAVGILPRGAATTVRWRSWTSRGTLSNLSSDLGRSGASTRRWAPSRRRSRSGPARPLHLSELVAAALGERLHQLLQPAHRRRARRGRARRPHDAPSRATAASPSSGPTPTRRSSRGRWRNIAVDLRSMGAHDEALEHASEAVALLRRLDAQVPGPFRFLLSAALVSLSLLALGLRARGRGAARERGGGRAAA